MTERPPLSKGELEVARALWDLGEATVRQVYMALPAERSIDFTTVQTYLRRLEAKRYAQARLEGRVRVYRTAVKPRVVVREVLEDIVDRLFGGKPLPLVRHLIEERGMTDQELAELRALLDRLERQRP